jgi:hypothetical protein
LRVGTFDALRPCDGGVLELSGVFGGKSSFAQRRVLLSQRRVFGFQDPQTCRQIVQPLDQ